MLELALLGALQEEGDLHGYELKKRLQEALGRRSSVSFGSLYPALGRLEKGGAVRVVTEGHEPVTAAPSIPMTGSFTGEAAAFRASHRRRQQPGRRHRKIYGITGRGRERLCELVADPADDDRAFGLKLSVCRWCDPATRLALLERRRAELAERLAEGRHAMRARGERLDRYVRSLLEHDTETAERDIAWLDRLLATEHELGGQPPATTTTATPRRQTNGGTS